ncbi:MAG TPA: UdgX family uracil-DNA binding protein [Frankiaceae bacterium]|nr:UdgX family uracil-DNA binding protein [Frankiaceae bacterium]
MPPARRKEFPTAAPFVPAGGGLDVLAAAAADCRGCDLYELPDTRTVFGEGPADARMVLVGEQPGDVEDRRGRPFVGPAGKLLDRALADAGVDRAATYVTNAVKHFKFTQAAAGKRRIHQTPDTHETAACKPWLVAELNLIRPEVVVLLGATAGQALLGPSFRVTKMRGQLLEGPPGSNALLLPTLHPSAVLRADEARREEVYAGFVRDLEVAVGALAAPEAP